MKDWTGNKKSVFSTLGASSHAEGERQKHDYYATDPRAMEMLLDLETFNKDILEPACGECHLSNVLKKSGYNVHSTDIVDRGCCDDVVDFLGDDVQSWHGDIITNPPFRFAKSFIEKAIQIIPEGNRVAMFLKLQFLEGQARRELFRSTPPKIVYVSSSRILCAKNGDFDNTKSSAVAYCWFIWEKGFKGDPIIKWFN